MSGIRGRDTKPELVLRKGLHKLGFRYRLDARDLPGRPDLVLPRFNAAVFVHGCFWHRHENCKLAAVPSSNKVFWSEKFATNKARDLKAVRQLFDMGWRVAIVWECALRSPEMEDVVKAVGLWVSSPDKQVEIPLLAEGENKATGRRRPKPSQAH
jgi:DNA mismatch endonuclease (patch repair protein)